MGRISPGPTRWPPGAERRLVPAKSNLKPQTALSFAVSAIIRTVDHQSRQCDTEFEYMTRVKSNIDTSELIKHFKDNGFLDPYIRKKNHILSRIISIAALCGNTPGIKCLVYIFSQLLIDVDCFNQFDNLTLDKWNSLLECFDATERKKICKTLTEKGYRPVKNVTRKEWITLTNGKEFKLSDGLDESEWGKFIVLIIDRLLPQFLVILVEGF